MAFEIKMEVLYRQTYNLLLKRWNVPKRKTGPKSWTPVNNVRAIISEKYGYAGAIRRIQRVFDKRRNPDGTRVWKTEIKTVYYPKTPKIGRSRYAVTYLKCTRTGYGFSRSM